VSSNLVYDVPPHNTPEPAVCSASTGADAGSKSYKVLLSAGLRPKVSGEDSEGFATVSYKKKPKSGTPSVKDHKTQCIQPLIGMRNSAPLPIVSKRERSKALFVSHFNPEVRSADVEKSLKEQLSLKMLVCTTLKTKFNSYASLHISVNEEDFPLINNTGVWPNEYLIAPFYGKLTSDQVYSSSAPLTSVTAVAPSYVIMSPKPKPTSTSEEHGGNINTS
jgi:hypothetical protein